MNTIRINDIIFHYQKSGTGKPVVLVHGNGEDHTIFKTAIEQLVSAGYCVYAPDSRGHGATGASNPPVTEFHYADMADDICAFIQALHLEKPAYYGFSDGGIIGLLLELRHPGTVGIMAISGTNLSPDGLDEPFVT
jgi:pimeloyl-ACP methyl ester carboxylesterase